MSCETLSRIFKVCLLPSGISARNDTETCTSAVTAKISLNIKILSALGKYNFWCKTSHSHVTSISLQLTAASESR